MLMSAQVYIVATDHVNDTTSFLELRLFMHQRFEVNPNLGGLVSWLYTRLAILSLSNTVVLNHTAIKFTLYVEATLTKPILWLKPLLAFYNREALSITTR
jgi:hypothetical protein